MGGGSGATKRGDCVPLTSMDKLTLHNLLAKGYFPRELPPPFRAVAFADVVTKNAKSLPVEFTQAKSEWCAYTPYSLARPGSLRRRLAIINPLPFYRLAKEIVAGQKRLFKLAARGGIAISAPTVRSGNSRAIESAVSLREFPRVRAQKRVAKCYALTADVSRFYPSIYTHTLDWAIQGKTKAKAGLKKKGTITLGTKIDKLVQAGQEGQTRGIPIGPDTSILLAHVLLGAVDKRLCAGGFAIGSRFMDDYELVFETRSEAERALAALEEALAEFELELSPQKTAIEELPISIEDEAIEELRTIAIRSTGRGQRFDLIHFFNRAFALSKQKPQRPILRYAVGRIRRIKVTKACGELLQELILQAASVEPGVWPKAIPALQRLRATNSKLPAAPLCDVVNMVVRQQAPRGHSSEVAWSLWAAIVFGLKLGKKEVNAVVDMGDDVCALLLLHAHSMKLVPTGTKLQKLSAYLSTRELRGRHWLLAYEAEKKGWIVPGKGGGISGDSVFEFLQKQGVEFYDVTAIPAVPKAAIKKSKAEEPVAGREDEFEGVMLDLDYYE